MKIKGIILSLALLPIVVILIIQFKFDNHQPPQLLKLNERVWIHRGGTPENSPEGIKKSLNLGHKSFEIDIHFIEDKGKGKFIVQHDFPNKLIEQNLLVLDELLEEVDDSSLQWWFDFKNLNSENLEPAFSLLKELEKKYSLKGRFFVEGSSYFPACTLSKKDIPVVFWINPHSKSRFFFIREVQNKLMVSLCNFSALTAYYESFTAPGSHTFENFPVILFTVNEQEKIDQYLQQDNILLVLKDLP